MCTKLFWWFITYKTNEKYLCKVDNGCVNINVVFGHPNLKKLVEQQGISPINFCQTFF